MDLEHYHIKHNRRKTLFWFTSTGMEKVIKVVEFQKMPDPVRYNLALGDYINNRVSYTNVTNNKDIEVVMASIAQIINDYTLTYPHREIYVTGDTEVKTRLYRRYVTRNLEEIEKLFYLWGQLKDSSELEGFRKGENYMGFLVKRM